MCCRYNVNIMLEHSFSSIQDSDVHSTIRNHLICILCIIHDERLYYNPVWCKSFSFFVCYNLSFPVLAVSYTSCSFRQLLVMPTQCWVTQRRGSSMMNMENRVPQRQLVTPQPSLVTLTHATEPSTGTLKPTSHQKSSSTCSLVAGFQQVSPNVLTAFHISKVHYKMYDDFFRMYVQRFFRPDSYIKVRAVENVFTQEAMQYWATNTNRTKTKQYYNTRGHSATFCLQCRHYVMQFLKQRAILFLSE